MSTNLTADRPAEQIARDEATPVLPAAPELRVWPAVVMVVAYWSVLIATYAMGMSNFERFISRFAALLVVFLAFSLWWLTRRAVRRRDRWLAVAVVLLISASTLVVADKSMDAFGLFMSAFPFIMTVGTIWLLIGKFVSPTVRRIGYCVAMLVAIGYFGLVRFDGLDAAQWGETSWRWVPTKEQLFLADRKSAGGTPHAANAAANSWIPQPGDCLEYRGPQRDGVVANVRLEGDWAKQPPKQAWHKRVGPGWSTMIVVDGHLVTQEQMDADEVVVCCDATTGEEIWVHKDRVRFEEKLAGAGPRGTPTFADGRIYALGATGILNCLQAETGEVVWTHDIVADAGVEPAEIPQWGYSGSPLVVDGLVVVFAGGSKDKGILAYRVDGGAPAWSCPAGKQSYSSPQTMTIAGQKQLVMLDSGGTRGIKIADGQQLWESPSNSKLNVPMIQPHQMESGDLVISSEPALVRLKVDKDGDKWTVSQKWANNRFRPGFNDFVVHDDFLYGLDDGILCAFDLETGQRVWKKRGLEHGQILLLPDQNRLVVSLDTGEIVLVSVNVEGYQELGRFQAIEGKTWNGPVIAGGKLFLRNGEEMASYDLVLKGSAAAESVVAEPAAKTGG